MPYAVDRETATTSDMFDAMTSVLLRLERLEEVTSVIGGLLMHHLGKLRDPSEGGTVEDSCAEIADYILLIHDMRNEARREAAFLDARE